MGWEKSHFGELYLKMELQSPHDEDPYEISYNTPRRLFNVNTQ